MGDGMEWLDDVLAAVIPILSKALPYATAGALAVSIVALATSWSSATSSGIRALREEMRELESSLLSPEMRSALRCVAHSAPIIRAAADNYSPWAHDKSYLNNANVVAEVEKGGARDADHLADAYSLICMSVSYAASIVPARKQGRLAKFWRHNSIAVYGQLNELLGATDEVRWELNKSASLWPLDSNTIGGKKLTLLSDQNLARNVNYLNSRRDIKKVATGIRIPNYPLPSRS
jgi:hypothetical protein